MKIGDRKFQQPVETVTATAKRNRKNVGDFLNLRPKRHLPPWTGFLAVPESYDFGTSDQTDSDSAGSITYRSPREAVFGTLVVSQFPGSRLDYKYRGEVILRRVSVAEDLTRADGRLEHTVTLII